MRREAWLSTCCGGFVVAQSGLYTNVSNQTTAPITAFPAVNSPEDCTIIAATVQLLYFAPENNTINYASTLVSDNYTLSVFYPLLTRDMLKSGILARLLLYTSSIAR